MLKATCRILCVSSLAFLVHILQASGATFAVTTDPVKVCSAIEIQGEILPGDYDRFVANFEEASTTAPLRRLYLNSAGGNLGTALAITDVVRNLAPNVETIVQPRHICNSACVIILTVGSRHHISNEASVSIHQAISEKTGKPDAEATEKIGRYFAQNGLPPDVIWTMKNLEPAEILAITPSNAKRLGFENFNFYGSTDPPATPQCSWKGFAVKRY